jgi:hypothetical protein
MDRFCDECGVSLNLHYCPSDPSPEDCDSAERKARIITTFWGRVR